MDRAAETPPWPESIARGFETPIENHGVIGDMRTVALVNLDGVIDYWCAPNLDSPSVFLSLLDGESGGAWLLAPVPETPGLTKRQMYLPDTNLLITRFLATEGMAEVTDFMPVDGSGRLIRRIEIARGNMEFRMLCAPRPDYGRTHPAARAVDDGVLFEETGQPLQLWASEPLSLEDGTVHGTWRLEAGHVAWFVLGQPNDTSPSYESVMSAYHATADYWRRWLGQSRYSGRWREVVQRSALALKLLTSEEHGSIAAAATFGLPEQPGGGRNWDYRYCWVRDAAFTVYALIRLGFSDEAGSFIKFLFQRAATENQNGEMQIMYAMNGARDMPESELHHLRGWRNSQPVRIGNAAYQQLQLDIYGELMDAVYLSAKHVGMVHQGAWRRLTASVNWVCANWQRPDEGIWEVRGGQREFLSSRLLCWVAVDRAVRLATKNSLPAPFERWEHTRNALHDSVLNDFWNEEIGCFVQHTGAETVDASVLLMPLLKFISPTDPLWLSTMRVVKEKLVSDCLVARYCTDDGSVDGLEGDEGAFTTCCFWYVECLARMGEVAEAKLLFEKLLSYANHLQLYSEELSPCAHHLGNFPQALTHLSLISAATYLDRALDGREDVA